MLTAFAFLAAWSPAQAACATTYAPAEIESRLAAAEAAYVALDVDAFRAAAEEARLLLPCLAGALAPSVAARVHRVEGLRLYAGGDEAGARLSLLAARIADPSYRFPDELLDPAHALRVAYEAMPGVEGKLSPVPSPRHGTLVLDGLESRQRPGDHATVFQVLDEARAPLSTTYLRPGDPLPDYARRPPSQVPLLVGAGVAVLGAGVLYGLAWSAHDAALDPADTTLDAAGLDALQAQALAFTVASGGALALGVGLGVGGVLPEIRR
ncbi:MAG: hypothetical protein FJ102_23760 [Deltaproteobacteria bacterium]|nr:hypothetical protein [Deltaproteobacteria bacterium]